jgi:hypothetical protein
MLACDSSIAPHDFASDKSYFGQLCLDRRVSRKRRGGGSKNLWINHPSARKDAYAIFLIAQPPLIVQNEWKKLSLREYRRRRFSFFLLLFLSL